MEVLLTSFGIGSRHGDASESPFYRMPPTMLSLQDRYLEPDYAAFLLSDTVILDEESYERLTTRRHWSYNLVAKTIKALAGVLAAAMALSGDSTWPMYL